MSVVDKSVELRQNDPKLIDPHLQWDTMIDTFRIYSGKLDRYIEFACGSVNLCPLAERKTILIRLARPLG